MIARPLHSKIGLIIFHPDLRIGGAERQIVNLVRGLSDTERYEITIALYERSGPLVPEVIDLPRVKVIEVGRFRKQPFSVLKRLIDLIEKEESSILYTFLVGPSLAGATLKLIRGIRVFVWGNRISTFNIFEFGFRGIIAHCLARLCIQKADMVVSNNDAGLQVSRIRGVESHRKIVIYNGIDTNIFFQSCDRRSGARMSMELEPKTIAIGFIGRIVAWKGVDVFIEAAKWIKSCTAVPIKFVVVGGGEVETLNTLKDFAKQNQLNNDFLWMGPRQDIELLLNGIDILTVCSKRGEGFPNIIGEAMACGTTVVATDVGDNQRILQNDQLIIPPENPSAMASVWQFLIDNPEARNKFGREGIDLVSRRYSVENMVSQTDRMLQNLDPLQKIA